MGSLGVRLRTWSGNGKALPGWLDSSHLYSIQTASGTPFQAALHSMLA